MSESDSHEVPPENEDELLYCVGDHALKQLAQKGCGFSFTGDMQELSEQHSE